MVKQTKVYFVKLIEIISLKINIKVKLNKNKNNWKIYINLTFNFFRNFPGDGGGGQFGNSGANSHINDVSPTSNQFRNYVHDSTIESITPSESIYDVELRVRISEISGFVFFSPQRLAMKGEIVCSNSCAPSSDQSSVCSENYFMPFLTYC